MSVIESRTSHQLIPPDQWNYVPGPENPADCASRGLYPSELLEHELWWTGPVWLTSPPSDWPQRSDILPQEHSDEIRQSCHQVITDPTSPLVHPDQYLSFNRLKRITAWILDFIDNCRYHECRKKVHPHLTTEELAEAEMYWISLSQKDHFSVEIESLKGNATIPESSPLLTLHPFLGSDGLIRVGSRVQNADISYNSKHPVILHGKHSITSLIISSEHVRLLHAGPTLVMASLSRRYHVVGYRKAIRSVTHKCITCCRMIVKPQNQMLAELPPECITPGSVFENVGVDYAGPFYIKYGSVRKPTIVKSYACIFLSLSVKAVHLESVSDLTTDALIATLRRFIARHGKPSRIWSDHGKNFIGASRELRELSEFLESQTTQGIISSFCSTQGISWKFIPEHAPNFGGLWEAAVKSMNTHLCRVVADVKLTFEEFTTILTQVETVLNSDDDGIEPLTPGHFLIGEWHQPTRNLQIGDVVLLQNDNLISSKWPLDKIVDTYPGRDGLVRVLRVKSTSGTYRRPVSKIALLLPSTD